MLKSKKKAPLPQLLSWLILPAFNKRCDEGKKHSLKRQRKRRGQTWMRQRSWNYQTGSLKQP